MLTFSQAIAICLLQKYGSWSGCASRAEFWWFALLTFMVDMAFNLMIGMTLHLGVVPLVLAGVQFLVGLALFIPNVMVTTWRLHDVGRIGWWQLLMLTVVRIPLLLYWAVSRSGPVNQYGEPAGAQATV